MRKMYLSLLLLVVACVPMPGCNMFNAHIKEFDLMRGIAADAAMRLTDGSMGQMQVSGQGLNPGIEIEAAVKYNATARYVGLAGQFGVAAQGQLGRAIDPKDILRIINDTSLTDSERQLLIKELALRIVKPATQPGG